MSETTEAAPAPEEGKTPIPETTLTLEQVLEAIKMYKDAEAKKATVTAAALEKAYRSPSAPEEPAPHFTIGPGYEPSADEIDAMRRRTLVSRKSREEFGARCEIIKRDIENIPRLMDELHSSHVPKDVKSVYQPRGIKAKVFRWIERALVRVSKFFSYKPELVEVVDISSHTGLPLTPEQKLLIKNIQSQFTLGKNPSHDDFIIACWDMVEATKPENVVRLPKETMAEAIRRIANEHLLLIDLQEKKRDAIDISCGLGDSIEERELADAERARGFNWSSTFLTKMEDDKGPAGRLPRKVKVGTTTDVDKIYRPDDGSLPSIGKKPWEIQNEDGVASNPVKPPTEDPLLAKAKEDRLKELLSKEELTATERDQLSDLTSNDVNVL